jgi:hypothetical protein
MALGALLVLVAPMSSPEIQAHFVKVVVLHRTFEIGVVDLVDATAYDGFEILSPDERSPPVVSVWRFQNLGFVSHRIAQVLFSPCPD